MSTVTTGATTTTGAERKLEITPELVRAAWAWVNGPGAPRQARAMARMELQDFMGDDIGLGVLATTFEEGDDARDVKAAVRRAAGRWQERREKWVRVHLEDAQAGEGPLAEFVRTLGA